MILRILILRSLPLLLLALSNLAYADVLEDILERGTIRFGVAEFVPWTMKSRSGELIGFEIDIANKLAKDMGLKAEFKLYPWNEVIPAVQSGEIDILTGGMSITPSRALQVSFSRPTADSGVGLATNTRMTHEIKTLEELNSPEITIAVVNGTLAHSVSKTLFDQATIKVFTTAVLAGKACVEGEAHAYLASLTQTRFLALNNSDKVDLPVKKPLLASKEALAIKKGEHVVLRREAGWETRLEEDRRIGRAREDWLRPVEWEQHDRQ